MGFVRRRARRRTALLVGGAAYAAGRHGGGGQGYEGRATRARARTSPAAASGGACPRRGKPNLRLQRAQAARGAARRRHPDRRGVRVGQGQDPRNLTQAVDTVRSRGARAAGGVPDLVVEESPAAADVALLEEKVAAAAIAAAGLGDEQEFAIFAAATMVRSWLASPASSGAGTASCRRCGSRSRYATVGSPARSSRARRPRRAGEAAGSSRFTPTICSLGASTSGWDTRRSGSSTTVRREARALVPQGPLSAAARAAPDTGIRGWVSPSGSSMRDPAREGRKPLQRPVVSPARLAGVPSAHGDDLRLRAGRLAHEDSTPETASPGRPTLSTPARR